MSEVPMYVTFCKVTPTTRTWARPRSSGHAPERKHGLSTEQFPVSTYVGSSENLKDLKDHAPLTDKK
jgi:hypothetical protein